MPHGVLAGGVVGGDVEHLFGGSRAFTPKLVDQCFAGGPRDERTNDLGVCYVRDGIALLGEASNVIAERLFYLLLAVLEVPWIPWAFVCALKISYKDLSQVRPAVDLIRRKVFKPGLCRVCEVEGEVSDDEIILLRPASSAGKAIVVEPKAGIRLSGVLGDVGRRTVPLRYVRAADVDTKDPGARRLWAHAAVLVAVVMTTSAWSVCAAD
jgi:hypothetical protein